MCTNFSIRPPSTTHRPDHVRFVLSANRIFYWQHFPNGNYRNYGCSCRRDRRREFSDATAVNRWADGDDGVLDLHARDDECREHPDGRVRHGDDGWCAGEDDDDDYVLNRDAFGPPNSKSPDRIRWNWKVVRAHRRKRYAESRARAATCMLRWKYVRWPHADTPWCVLAPFSTCSVASDKHESKVKHVKMEEKNGKRRERNNE